MHRFIKFLSSVYVQYHIVYVFKKQLLRISVKQVHNGNNNNNNNNNNIFIYLL